MTPSNFDSIFERWKAALAKKSRSRKDVPVNFDELFEELHNAGATLDDVKVICHNAIKAHLPTTTTAKYIWNRVRGDPKFSGLTYNEFLTDWTKDITDAGNNSMYLFFPLPKAAEDDGEPKILGDNKISLREYKLLRSHADQFRPVDLKNLEMNNSELLTEEELLELVRNRTDG